jgi:hypothetical protein
MPSATTKPPCSSSRTARATRAAAGSLPRSDVTASRSRATAMPNMPCTCADRSASAARGARGDETAATDSRKR